MSFDCCLHQCKRKNYLQLTDYLISPFDTADQELNKLFSYFLHKAPEISSIHSKHIDCRWHEDIYLKMLDKSHVKYARFCNFNVQIEKELEKGTLHGDKLCLKCKRFVCKRKKPDKGIQETDLTCFLRHIRNSIAHGRVYYYRENKHHYICFEDYNSSNKKLSARIICNKTDLKNWKSILSDSRLYD